MRYRIRHLNAGTPVTHSGGQLSLTEETEEKLARCISELCRLGFSVTVNEIIELVAEYLSVNNIIITKFKDNKQGTYWLSGFMKRHNLSLKKAEMICLARKSVTENPFIIFGFYDILSEIIESKNLTPAQIWNCDESAFSSDPNSYKVVGVKGKSAYRVTPGPGRENTTVLSACNAAGRALPPLVIFAGKNLQSSWYGDKALEGTTYSISDSGWMTTEVFASWFDHFIAVVEERPLLLILDGHITHTSLSVIEKAIDENVTILKLPPHSTDLLQPLDVACFAPIKRLWTKQLNLWLNQWGARTPVRRHNLVNLLGEIWYQGLSPKNVIAGFNATGIFPVDRSKYPSERLNTNLVRRYDTWVAAGKPEDVEGDLATAVSTPRKISPRKEIQQQKETPGPSNTTVTLVSGVETSTPEARNDQQNCEKCRTFENSKPQGEAPSGKMWVEVHTWTLVNIPVVKTPQKSDTSFEELVVNKMKGPPQKQEAATRRRCDMKSKVVTGDVYLQAIKAAHDRVNKRKIPTKKRGKAKKLQKLPISSSSSSSEEEEEDEEEFISPEISAQTATSTVSQIQSLIIEITAVIKSLDDDKVNSFYAVYYGNTYYWGKQLKCFSFDPDSDVEQVEMSFLRYRGNHHFDYPQKKGYRNDRFKVCIPWAIYSRYRPRERLLYYGGHSSQRAISENQKTTLLRIVFFLLVKYLYIYML